MPGSRIYLDNNATTALDPRVATKIVEAFQSGPANPSSLHASGRRWRHRLDQAIDVIGKCIGTRLDRPGGPRLIITSGGTESNNMALAGIGSDGPIVVSRMEHPSVLATAKALQATGRSIRWLDVDCDGSVLVEQLPQLISGPSQKATLVSIMSANNETGVIQPIARAAEICRAAAVPLHVDATQSIGKVPVDLDSLGASAVTFTAHKFHGPPGIGGLWLDRGLEVRPLMHGGQQQLESRPGTEPVALADAMAEALRLATDEMQVSAGRIQELRDRLEMQLLQRHSELVIQGSSRQRLPGTSCISFLGTDRQSMLMALDLAGVDCSSGAACSSGSSPPSHVLIAMNRPEGEVRSSLRFGVSKFSTAEEIDRAIESISKAYKHLHKMSGVDN